MSSAAASESSVAPQPAAEAASAPTLELTVLMPCLNEAETLATCIRKAQGSLRELGIDGEVLIADNGSDDGSQDIARSLGARVVDVPVRGYGAALRAGIAAARGTYVIMADADDSYALDDLEPFVEQLRQGADLVMGNRFTGTIEPGAMPPLHKYLGNPVLSFLGRRFFRLPIGDFHCGMRGFRRDSILRLDLHTTGMEFASEMVVKASMANLTMTEVPTTLRPDGRTRAPHLRTWRDGWRHLRFLLLYSPRWLFLYPGMVLFLIGVVGTTVLAFGPLRVGSAVFDLQSMLVFSTMAVLGVQSLMFAVIARVLGAELGFLPATGELFDRHRIWSLERGLVAGAILTLVGFVIIGYQVFSWAGTGFGALELAQSMRISILGSTLLLMGVQLFLSSFLVSIPRVQHS